MIGSKITAVIALSAVLGGVVCALASVVSPAIPVTIAVVVVAAVCLVKRPELGMPIALGLLWTNSTGVAHFYHSLPSATGAIVVVLLLFPLAARYLKGDRLRLDAGIVWLAVFVLAEFLAAAGSLYQSVALAEIEKTIQEGLIVYLLVLNVVRTPEALRTATWALIVSGTLLALMTMVQSFGHLYDHTLFGFAQPDHAFFQGKDASFRAQGPLDDANYYAQILATTLALAAVAMFRERTPRARTWARICATAMLVAIVQTYSRGGALAVATLVVLLVVLRYMRPRHVLAAVAVTAALLIAFPSYVGRLGTLGGIGGATASTGSSTAADLSVQQRATENLAAWLAIQGHPILGLGPGVFPHRYQYYAEKVGGAIHTASTHADATDKAGGDTAGEQPARAAPNIFLSVAADDGAVGLAALLCLIGCACIGLVRTRRRWAGQDAHLEGLATGYLLAIISYVVAGFFLALAFERFLWVLIALCGTTTTILLRRRAPRAVREVDRGWVAASKAAVDLSLPEPDSSLLEPDASLGEPDAVGAGAARGDDVAGAVARRGSFLPHSPTPYLHLDLSRRVHGPVLSSALGRRPRSRVNDKSHAEERKCNEAASRPSSLGYYLHLDLSRRGYGSFLPLTLGRRFPLRMDESGQSPGQPSDNVADQ